MTLILCSDSVGTVFPHYSSSYMSLQASFRNLRGWLRNTQIAVLLSLVSTVVLYAEGAPQEWLPDVLDLPSDMEVLTDRAVGSTIRMFSFRTSRDPDELMKEWEEDLMEGGYIVRQIEVETVASIIEFSGSGILNAQIAVIPPTSDQDPSIFEFDATLK
ncbi:hypothetical protein [Paracoccus saliphilus]|uniref:Uncharacterized protein n=1 Tax=Paracoccus saliphilus TaxID=405559 RepID=A0AA45W7E3_9RHOB|nr:hypothetical protein [Paracoccus saliphilus]WCR02722.1 hypothetical protein JHX88_18060 [Paracoccus saliphilus]SIT09248.1 hypothetical protein SAMN05421772_11744 [Paracoccus saliphilus]